MALDFSKLEDLSYRGFKDKKTKDELTEQGYIVVEDEETPFSAPPAPAGHNTTPRQESPAERKLRPFTGKDTERNYRAMYRAACNFHEAHNPPAFDGAYWQTHTYGVDEVPRIEAEYWERTAHDIAWTAYQYHNDPFITGLLMAVYDELEREYRGVHIGKINVLNQ